MTVSTSQTPAFEDIRSFVQFDDLIYAAAGSGGILVYRIIGDSKEPVLNLSLTNLYSDTLEQIYVRTIEIIQSLNSTNLIFAYDTLTGGGIGIAEITPTSTKPLGSLKTDPGLRIRSTVTTFNPQGIYHVLAASEGIGVLSYDISFNSNSYFEQPKIAALIDYVSISDIEQPAQAFLSLNAPNLQKVTNINQITNIENLIKLAIENPNLFSSVVSNIPFLSLEQQGQIAQVLSSTDQVSISNILILAQDIVGADTVNKILEDPTIINTFLNNSSIENIVTSAIPMLSNNIDLSSLQQAGNTIDTNDIQNILSLSGLQNIVQNDNQSTIIDTNLITNTNKETDTLFEEINLSNLNLAGIIDTELVHNTNYNPFVNRTKIGNARLEIQETVAAIGRRFFVEEDESLKQQLKELNYDELFILFSSLFEQAQSAITLLPLFESYGINIQELYQLWLTNDYYKIIDLLDSSIIAELLRRLPRYQIETTFQLKQTNIVLPSIRNMNADSETLYIAAGEEGIFIIDRVSGKIISSKKKPFSEVSMVVPYQYYGQNYYAVTDLLNGITIYQRERNKKIGQQISSLTLVGEAFSVFPYEDILWVADGSDGVLAIRFNKNKTLTIEAELYQKQGIAYYVGAARRREALVSYGADGLKRLRITNVLPKNIGISTLDPNLTTQIETQQQKDDLIDRTLEWGKTSSIAIFIRKLFFL